jgi:hypothetical protein
MRCSGCVKVLSDGSIGLVERCEVPVGGLHREVQGAQKNVGKSD